MNRDLADQTMCRLFGTYRRFLPVLLRVVAALNQDDCTILFVVMPGP